jgi:hypothetical protein
MPIAHQSKRCVAQLTQGGAHRFGIDLTGRRQPDIAAVAFEQLAAELVLQKSDLAADGALGQIELPCGGGEAAQPGDRLEGGKGADTRQKAALHVHVPLLTLIDRRSNFV